MNFHLAFLLYPGAIFLFVFQNLFGKNFDFNEFRKGKFEIYSYITSLVLYLLLFYFLKNKI